MSRVIDLTGQRFGKLVVVARGPNTRSGKAKWVCRCDCGGDTCSYSSDLRLGKSTNCGCVRIAKSTARFSSHGKTATLTYRRWTDMKQRVRRNPNYKNIQICDRWTSFEYFVKDMGECPIGYSLERLDNTGGYEPANCTWIPIPDQAKNTRRSLRFCHQGEVQPVKEWCRRLNLNEYTVYSRINRGGWSIGQALGLEPRTPNAKDRRSKDS